MANRSMDPFGKLMGLRYKSHPWHGVEVGPQTPEIVTCFIEMVPTDTVKYEVDKASGYLRIDRPQKYSNILPALYGFIPQTYCDKLVSSISSTVLNRPEIVGDKDPLDICVLTEKVVPHNDILVRAQPIGGFRMIDGNQADDKIIAVLKDDALYGKFKDISDVPAMILNRLKHYFLTYKDMPGEEDPDSEIPDIYGHEEAYKVIRCAMEDYQHFVESYIFGK